MTLKDFSGKGRCYFADDFEFDEKAVAKNLKDPHLGIFLPELADRIAQATKYAAEDIEEIFRSYSDEKQIKAGLIINGARTAISGGSVGPSLFEMMEVIGRDRVVGRLRDSIKLVGKN